MTNKEKTKDDKRLFKQKSNLATFSNRVYEIESDWFMIRFTNLMVIIGMPNWLFFSDLSI